MTVSYPRRQQYRRLRSAGRRAAQTGVALAAAALCARDGQAALAATLVALAAVHAMSSRRALRLAARSRLGAKSEAQVRRELDALVREGWHVRHSVDWPMPGDIDHVVRAPTGIALVIETKTLRHARDHLRRTKAAAAWIARGRRRYPHGVLPVLCVTRVRRVEHMEAGVLIVSLDRPLLALRATTSRRPARPLRARPPARGRIGLVGAVGSDRVPFTGRHWNAACRRRALSRFVPGDGVGTRASGVDP